MRSFAGVERADLRLSGINVVGGLNAAGKTSLLEAIACGLLQNTEARGMRTKKNLERLVRDEADGASVQVRCGDQWKVDITWPDGEIVTLGDVPAPPSPVAIGARQFSSLSQGDRFALMLRDFGVHPEEADFREFLMKHPDLEAFCKLTLKDGKTMAVDAAAAMIAKRVREQGWDAVEATFKEEATKRRGAWEQISGVRFGARIADNWRPVGLRVGETYDRADLVRRADEAKAANDAAQRAAGASQAERDRLAGLAGQVEALDQDMATLGGQAEEITRQIREAVVQANVDKIPTDNDLVLLCAHCQKPNRLVPVTSAAAHQLYELLAPATPAQTPEEQAAAKERGQKLRDEMARLRKLLAENDGQQNEKRGLLLSARAARQALAKVQNLPLADEADVAAKRIEMGDATAMLEAFDKFQEARQAAAAAKRDRAFQAAVEADGVRGLIMGRTIDELNAKLAALCVAGKRIKTVTIDAEMQVYYGNRLWNLLSKSERWRADFVVGLAIAQAEKAPCYLVDELDMLDPEDRAGPLLALRATGQAAVLAMTARSAAVLPTLRKAKAGLTWWMDNGSLKPAKEAD